MAALWDSLVPAFGTWQQRINVQRISDFRKAMQKLVHAEVHSKRHQFVF